MVIFRYKIWCHAAINGAGRTITWGKLKHEYQSHNTHHATIRVMDFTWSEARTKLTTYSIRMCKYSTRHYLFCVQTGSVRVYVHNYIQSSVRTYCMYLISSSRKITLTRQDGVISSHLVSTLNRALVIIVIIWCQSNISENIFSAPSDLVINSWCIIYSTSSDKEKSQPGQFFVKIEK